jgi:hypothetical protein
MCVFVCACACVRVHVLPNSCNVVALCMHVINMSLTACIPVPFSIVHVSYVYHHAHSLPNYFYYTNTFSNTHMACFIICFALAYFTSCACLHIYLSVCNASLHPWLASFHAYIYIYIHVYMYIYIYTCIYVYNIYIYIYIPKTRAPTRCCVLGTLRRNLCLHRRAVVAYAMIIIIRDARIRIRAYGIMYPILIYIYMYIYIYIYIYTCMSNRIRISVLAC